MLKEYSLIFFFSVVAITVAVLFWFVLFLSFFCLIVVALPFCCVLLNYQLSFCT